jgi:hypothetical protein
MQPFFGLFVIATCLGVWWWNRRSGGYNGARPNWWKLILCGLFAVSGMFATGRFLLNSPSGSILGPALSAAYGIMGLYLLSGEVGTARKGRIAAGQPRMANPWKLFVCFGLAMSGIDGVLRPMRGPLVPSNTDQAQGAVAMSAMLAVLGLVGVASELRRLYIHAKSLK